MALAADPFISLDNLSVLCFDAENGGLPKMKIVLPLVAAVCLAACARAPEKIESSYVSPMLYQNLTCEQVQLEATRVSGRAADLTAQQQKNRNNDAAAVAVGVVLFWPALFFISGDDAQTGELARVKGEMQAIEQASIANNCGLIFQAPPQRAAAETAKVEERYPVNR